MSLPKFTIYQMEEHFKTHPNYLKDVFRELHKETAIEFKDRLTSKEAAKYLNISVKTLDNLCCDRKIPYFKVGKSREFLLEDLKQYRLNKEKYIPSLESNDFCNLLILLVFQKCSGD